MSTAPPTAVMARLGCARMVLTRGRAIRTAGEQKLLSQTQVDAIVAEMQTNSLGMKRMDPGAASRMSSLASSVPWAEGHLGVVLQQMRRCQSSGMGSGGARRWTTQYATPAILAYFT